MKMSRARKAVVASVAVFILITGATAAFAATALRASTTGADFGNKKSDGYWRWCPFVYPYGYCQNGGWNFYGTLTDTVTTDGDNVYSKVQVEAYTPNSFYGTQNGQKYQAWEVYAPDEIYTQGAQYWVCRDRSFPYSDNCSTGQYHHR
jgi:hypothetical protein